MARVPHLVEQQIFGLLNFGEPARVAVAMSGDLEDLPELQDLMKKQRAERDALNKRIAALTEPIDRAALRMTLEQRSTDWKQKLRSDYPDEARFVVQQLLGPLKLWFVAREDVEQGDYLREHYGLRCSILRTTKSCRSVDLRPLCGPPACSTAL